MIEILPNPLKQIIKDYIVETNESLKDFLCKISGMYEIKPHIEIYQIVLKEFWLEISFLKDILRSKWTYTITFLFSLQATNKFI